MNPYKMVIAVANQKGGCAKTTTAVNLAAALSKGSKKQKLPPAKVLLIDLDPQGNCATSFGVEKKKVKKTAYDLLTNDSGEQLSLMEDYLISPKALTDSMQDAWSMRNGGKSAPENISVENLSQLDTKIANSYFKNKMVTNLNQNPKGLLLFFPNKSATIKSYILLKVKFREDSIILAMGSKDKNKFTVDMQTDLVEYLIKIIEINLLIIK